MSREQSIEWNGKKLLVTFKVCPAEPDVGIMAPYPDVLSIVDENTGEELPPLKIDEEEEINRLIVIEDQ